MVKLFFLGWYVVTTYSIDNGKHVYLVENKMYNQHIALNLDKPLSYGEGANIKLKFEAECQKVTDPWPIVSVHHLYCNADKVKELKCTKHNSFVINGIRYC